MQRAFSRALFSFPGVVGMGETVETRLKVVETLLDQLVKGVGELGDDVKEMANRLTRLEESTHDAVPYVWKLRERTAELERDTANLRLEFERLRQDFDNQRQKTGTRWWDVAKIILSPAVAALVAWLIAK